MTQYIAMATGHDETRSMPQTILYVEDHADTLEVIGNLLRSHGYDPMLAPTYSCAMEIAGTLEHLDVLIADLLLPDGDGCDLFRVLRSRWPALSGICLSACGMAKDVERSHAAGFQRHIIKPTDFGTLHSALREVSQIAPPA